MCHSLQFEIIFFFLIYWIYMLLFSTSVHVDDIKQLSQATKATLFKLIQLMDIIRDSYSLALTLLKMQFIWIMLTDLWIELTVHALFAGFSIAASETYIHPHPKNPAGGTARFFAYSLWKRIPVGSKLNCITGSSSGRMNLYCSLIQIIVR